MRKLLVVLSLVVVLLASVPARAQNTNGLYSGVAQTLTYIQQQYVFAPMPQATVTVCYYPAVSPSPGLPCTNLAQLYADATTATPAASQFAADLQGNFSFWAPVGYYQYTLTNLATNVTTGPYAVVISPGSGGGGGGGAVFPFPGVVYATSNSAGTVATSSQVVSTLNTSPVTQLLPSLLPIATTSSLGAVQPDNVSIIINPTTGVISSVPPTTTIPATSSVIKGTGVLNVGAAAIPGTDYVVPAGSILGSAGSLSAASLLPNGMTAVTQTTGDNTTRVATDAFVIANQSAGVTTPATSLLLKGAGTANSVLAATPGVDYVIPSGSILGTSSNVSGTPALPNGTTATTQTTGDNSTKLATTAFVIANAGTSSIPATTSVLKGSGSANSAVAATAGTDYLAPSALPATTSLLKGSGIAGSVATAIPNVDYIAANLLTTQGDLVLRGSSAPTRFPANANAGQAVLVSTAATSSVAPTTKTCAHEAGASINTSACTWSTTPVAGEAIFCTVFNSASSTTFSIADSAGNTYVPYGSVHFGTTTSQYTQTFYTAPISSSVATTTATASSGNFLAVQCNSANNIAASSPTDGQGTVDVTASPIQLSSPITTTAAGDYIYCATVAYFAETLSAGPGFTGGASANNNYLNQYTTQGAAGPITPSMTGSTSNSASMTCSAFKAGSAVTPASTAWNQSISLANVQATNLPVIPIPSTPSGGDDYTTLQTAINTAIAENRELLIPAGEWKTSQTLVANTQTFRMRGAGPQFNVAANQTSYISATAGVTTLSIGTGTVNSNAPAGYLRDIGLFGYGKPAVGSPTGVACLQVNGVVQFDTDNVILGGCDIGLDLTGNSYGSQFSNMSICQGANCNAAVNLRIGSQSGSDISFYNDWTVGAFCSYCIAGQGGGYHIINGQMGVNESGTPNDNAGCVVLTYDYLTAASTGQSDVDIHGTSMEGCQGGWVFRGYGATFLTYESGSMNPTSSSQPALGVYKNTNMSYGKAVFIGDRLSGYFSGANLLSLSGSTLTGPYLTEVGTQSSAQNPTINGVYTYVDSMTNQSGLSGVTVGSDQVGIESAGMWYGNNSGTPQYSSNHGTTWANFFTNPMTQLGQFIYGGPGGAATVLAGNATATDEVLVSHGVGGTPVAETYTCGAFASGTGNSETCTWSTPPTTGMFVACGVTNAQGGSASTVTDSASNAYLSYGGLHTLWNTGSSQTFYFGPLTGTITTTTVNTASGNFLALKCQAVTNVQPVTDGQCSVDTTGTTLTCGSAITTTSNNDYVFCPAVAASGTLTAGSGFTLGSTDYGAYSANQYKIQTTAGTLTPSITNSTSTTGSMTCSAFKSQSAQAPTLSNTPAISLANVTTPAPLTASEESVASSATPTFSITTRESTTVLTANVTSFTLAAGAAGQEKTLTFCQNGTGGYTVAAPTNVHGFMTVGVTASKCSSQHFTYNSIQTAWLADSPGVVNQ